MSSVSGGLEILVFRSRLNTGVKQQWAWDNWMWNPSTVLLDSLISNIYSSFIPALQKNKYKLKFLPPEVT